MSTPPSGAPSAPPAGPADDGDTPAPRGSRRARRRERTRAALLDAARQVIADHGVDAASIKEIAERADVGFGTFYGYFASKDDLLATLVADTLAALADENDRLCAGLEDPAERFSASVRHTAALADRDPVVARFIVALGLAQGAPLWAGLAERLGRDLRAGRSAKRFRWGDDPVSVLVVGGAVVQVMWARLHQIVPESAYSDVAARLLGSLGMPADEATRVSRRKLPPLPTMESTEPC